jgi:hypothetical protein
LVEQEQSNKTEIIRRALEGYIRHHQQQTKYRQMQEYAQQMAPHSREFVAESDAAVSEQLLRATDW